MSKILIYAVSISHLRKAILIANNFINYEFVVIYELKNPFKSHNNISFVKINKYKVIDKLFNNKFSYFILFNCQIRKNVLQLLIAANLYKLKTISLQENNNYFLHQKKINNYQLPTDLFCVLSDYEKGFYLENGYDSKKIIVKNFYFNNKKDKKSSIKKKIVFCLNASENINPNSIENENNISKVFQSIFYCLNHLNDIKICIKKHPLDNKSYLNKVINKNKEVEIINDNIDLTKYLTEKDIVILTGYSQLILDLTNINIPVIIFNIESNKNILKNYLSVSIIEKSEELLKIVKDKNVKKYIDDYSKLLKLNNVNKFNKVSNLFKIIDNHFKDYEYSTNNLFILLLWSKYLNLKLLNSKKIKQLLNKTISKNQFSLLQKLEDNSVNFDDLIKLKKYKYNNLCYFMIYILYFLNIKNINTNYHDEFISFFNKFKPYGAYNIFYPSIQNLRNILFDNNKSLYLFLDTLVKNDKYYLEYDKYYKKNKISIFNFIKKILNKLSF